MAEKTRILVLMERTVERRQRSVLTVAEQSALLGTYTESVACQERGP